MEEAIHSCDDGAMVFSHVVRCNPRAALGRPVFFLWELCKVSEGSEGVDGGEEVTKDACLRCKESVDRYRKMLIP